MKKIFAFFVAVNFLAVGTLSTTACGVSQGQKVLTNVDAPEKATKGQDPTKEYVYNDKYLYSQTNINLAIGIASQLAVQKIRENIQGTEGIWKEFYNSDEWKKGFFTSFNYEPQFSFKAEDGRDLIFQVKNNDLSDDNNKLRSYWFVPLSGIDIPLDSEFDDNKEKKIVKDGWINIYLIIGKFKIDFDAQLNFVFSRIHDKNDQSQVILNGETFSMPLGEIDFNHPEKVYNERINKINISIKENS